MKRSELLLALTGATAAGVIAGYLMGQAGADPRDPRANAPAPTVQAADDAGELPPLEHAQVVVQRSDWLRAQVAQFANAQPGQPTPRLAEAFRDATLSEPPFDQARLISLIEMLRKEDFPAALEILRKAKTSYGVPGSTGQPMWLAFWRRFGELDPDRALSAALASKEWKLPNQSETEKQVFNGIARNNPAAAAATFLAHPELENRDSAVRGIMEAWMKKDPRGALAWTQGLEPELQSDAYYAAGWGSTNRYDISDGTALLKDVPAGEAQNSVARALKNMLGTRPYVPTSQVLSLMDTLRGAGLRDANFEGRMAQRIAQEDPYAAANYFAQPAPASAGPAQPISTYGITTALQQISGTGSKVTITASPNFITQSDGTGKVLTQIAVGPDGGLVGQVDGTGNITFTHGDLPADGNRDLRTVANTWANSDPKAAENWLKDRDEKSPAYQTFALALAQAAQQRGDTAEFERWQAKLPPGAIKEVGHGDNISFEREDGFQIEKLRAVRRK